MLPESYEKLSLSLKTALKLNKARAACFAACILGVIASKSVKLANIACYLPGKGTQKSKFRRLQDFFNEVDFRGKLVAAIILGILGRLTGEKLVLAIDRTEWSSRGNTVNMLCLSVCLGDVGIPIFWTDFRDAGCSNTVERLSLLKRFITFFGPERIGCLVGDREFIGRDWFAELQKLGIPFLMRLKKNTLIIDSQGKRKQRIENRLHHLNPNEHCSLGVQEVCRAKLSINAIRLKTGELLILGSLGLADHAAADLYLKRWNIEVGFEKLKSQGFDIESSRLRGRGKYERLFAVMAIAMAWCYEIGEWGRQEQSPIKIKSHGRKEQSIFRRGIDLLASMLSGCSDNLLVIKKKAFNIIKQGFIPKPTAAT